MPVQTLSGAGSAPQLPNRPLPPQGAAAVAEQWGSRVREQKVAEILSRVAGRQWGTEQQVRQCSQTLMHSPLSQQISLTKHKLKDKINQNFKVISTEHEAPSAESLLRVRPCLRAPGAHAGGWACRAMGNSFPSILNLSQTEPCGFLKSGAPPMNLAFFEAA